MKVVLASDGSACAKEAARVLRDLEFDDGILTEEEIRDLEALRIDLGLGKHAASQILDAEVVEAALKSEQSQGVCPQCHQPMPG